MIIGRRWNKFWIGLALGMVLPLVVFCFVYLFGYSKTLFGEFVKKAFDMGALPKFLSLCVISNLTGFYFFLNKEYWYATRGVITATLLYTLAIVLIKFLA